MTTTPHFSRPVRRLWSPWRARPSIALDLGSARTRACVPGRGVVLDVPTVAFAGTPGLSYPVQRGCIVDPEATARMLHRLLQRYVPPFARPVFAVTTPVLGGVIYREAARKALELLQPRTVLTVPTPRAIALGAAADLSRPLLIIDIGAHLTEAFVLARGGVTDARRTPLGTCDLDGSTTSEDLVDAVAAMVTGMIRQDRTPTTLDALHRGVLIAGGGAALRPDMARRIAERLNTPADTVPVPHAAAVRGAADLLGSPTHRPPSAEGGGHGP